MTNVKDMPIVATVIVYGIAHEPVMYDFPIMWKAEQFHENCQYWEIKSELVLAKDRPLNPKRKKNVRNPKPYSTSYRRAKHYSVQKMRS